MILSLRRKLHLLSYCLLIFASLTLLYAAPGVSSSSNTEEPYRAEFDLSAHQLKQIIAMQQNQNENLKAEIKLLREENTKGQKNIEDLKLNIEQCKGKLLYSCKRLEHKEQHIQSGHVTIKQISAKLNQCTLENQQLKATNNYQEQEYEKLLKDAEQLQAENLSLKESYQNLQEYKKFLENAEQLQAEILKDAEQLQAENLSLKKSYQNLQEINERLRVKLERIEVSKVSACNCSAFSKNFLYSCKF